MESQNVIYMALGVLLFCFGLSFLFYGNRELSKLITVVQGQEKLGTVLNKRKVNEEELTVSATFEEVICLLMNDTLPCEIEINNLLFLPDSYDYKDVDFSGISDKDYKREYWLDRNGNVIRTIFN